MVIGNVGGMLCYVFQATNRVNVYSTSVLIDKMSFIVAVLVLLFYKERSFVPFILLYLTGKTISFIYTVIKGRDMVFHKGVPIAQAMTEVKVNVFTGITLMLSNIASMLILGSGRFVVDNLWGINAFGKFSFSVSLANFFLLFISQASMVLFPVLRQANDKNLKKFYSLVRDLLDLVLPGAFLFYIPVKVILSRWLPQYTESLTYLVLLLPLCTFDSKMNLLCTTYMKVLRLERTLLWINGISFGVSIGLSLLGGYVFHNIYLIIVFMVVSVAFREILSEWVLSRFLELSFLRSVLTESILSVGFVCFTWFLPSAVGFACYAALYGGYLLIFRKSIRSVLHESRRVFHGK
jgi:O-antigen/teichoic acid export membrane protein